MTKAEVHRNYNKLKGRWKLLFLPELQIAQYIGDYETIALKFQSLFN